MRTASAADRLVDPVPVTATNAVDRLRLTNVVESPVMATSARNRVTMASAGPQVIATAAGGPPVTATSAADGPPVIETSARNRVTSADGRLVAATSPDPPVTTTSADGPLSKGYRATNFNVVDRATTTSTSGGPEGEGTGTSVGGPPAGTVDPGDSGYEWWSHCGIQIPQLPILRNVSRDDPAFSWQQALFGRRRRIYSVMMLSLTCHFVCMFINFFLLCGLVYSAQSLHK